MDTISNVNSTILNRSLDKAPISSQATTTDIALHSSDRRNENSSTSHINNQIQIHKSPSEILPPISHQSSASEVPLHGKLITGRKAARSLRIFRGVNQDEGISEDKDQDEYMLSTTQTNTELEGSDLEPVSSATYIPHTPIAEDFEDDSMEGPAISTGGIRKPQHLTANVEYDHGLNGDITKISTIYNKLDTSEEVLDIERALIKLSRSSTPIIEERSRNDIPEVSQKIIPNESTQEPQFPLAVELRPFKNKVGGHTAIFSFSKRAVCKALVNRENIFYETIELKIPQLLKFMPKYIGVLNVRYSSVINEFPQELGELKQEKDSITEDPTRVNILSTPRNIDRVDSGLMTPEVVLDDNKHIIPNELWQQYSNSLPSPKQSDLFLYDSNNVQCTPSVSSSLNSPLQRPTNPGSTLINTDLQVQVLQEVFNPSLKLHGNEDNIFSMDDEVMGKDHPQEFPSPTVLITTGVPMLRKHTRFERFILLEDLTTNIKQPCVLDLKMGTRQYGIEATCKKQQSQRRKCLSTTSRRLGVRVCGLQIYKYNNQRLVHDKYFGRKIKIGKQFCKILAKFLYNGRDNYSILFRIPDLIDQIKELYSIFSELPGYRMYGSSVLLMYEGGGERYDHVNVKIIDFAQSIISENHQDAKIPPQHPNLVDLGYLRGLNSLITYFTIIFKVISGKNFIYTQDMKNWVKENKHKLENENNPWLDEFAERENLINGGINEDDNNVQDDPFNVEYPEYTQAEDIGISE